MSDFKEGDCVWNIVSDEHFRVWGVSDDGKWVVVVADGGLCTFLPSNLELIYRPSSTDPGAQEYEEIMSLQNVYPSTD